MTVAVAVKKNGSTVLAADSLVHFGGQRWPAEDCVFHKIHRVGETLIAWAGWSIYAELLTAHLAKSAPPELSSEAEVFDFFVGFWRSLRSDYALTRMGGDEQLFANLDSVFLLANRHGIFRVAGDMDVTEFQQYCAVGTGAKYALGAMRVLYSTEMAAREIAERGVAVGIDFDVNCGGPVEVAVVGERGDGPPGGKESGPRR